MSRTVRFPEVQRLQLRNGTMRFTLYVEKTRELSAPEVPTEEELVEEWKIVVHHHVHDRPNLARALINQVPYASSPNRIHSAY
jgi:hypothetical protein